MVLEKTKNNLIAWVVFFLNIVLAAGGVLYMKNQDVRKKQMQLDEKQNNNEEIAMQKEDQVQKAIFLDRENKLKSIEGNSGAITRNSTETVQKSVPAVTRVITNTSNSTRSSSSKTTKSS